MPIILYSCNHDCVATCTFYAMSMKYSILYKIKCIVYPAVGDNNYYYYQLLGIYNDTYNIM